MNFYNIYSLSTDFFLPTQFCDLFFLLNPANHIHIAQLFLGLGSVMECGQPSRDHIIIENSPCLSQQLSNVTSSSAKSGVASPPSPLYAWILFEVCFVRN